MSAHPIGNWAAKITEIIDVDGLIIIRVSTTQTESMLLHLSDNDEFTPAIGDRLMLDVTPDSVTVEYLGAPQ